MKTYTKEDFHNPEELTRQQVGEEYRLLLSEEVDGRFGDDGTNEAQCVGTRINSELNWIRAEFASCLPTTYRVPLATPLPDGTVLSSNDCCWSNAKPSDPRKVVYCCGPMSNMPDYNFPAFFEAAAKLEKQGYKVLNPAQMDLDSGWTLEEIKDLDAAQFQEFLKGAAKRDLDALQQCDAIALLPGWENSKGARAEKAVAEWLGLDVMYLDGAVNPDYQNAPFSALSFDGNQWSEINEKQPYNSDERAEWDVSSLMSKLQSSIAPDDPKGAAGAKKPPMHLLPPNALIETAKAMGHGAAKYGAWNFIETTVCASTYVGALGRHWVAYARSEDIDPDSGLPHLALIASNCFVLLTAQQQGTLRDDRPKLK